MKRLIGCLLMPTFLFMISCTKKRSNDLELKISNNKLECYTEKSKKKAINVIDYTISNNSDATYYFNNKIVIDSLIKKFVIHKNGLYFSVFKKNGEEMDYGVGHRIEPNIDCLNDYEEKRAKFKQLTLGYNHPVSYFSKDDNENFFFIFPHQKIHFECYLSLNKILDFDGSRIGIVELESGQDYYGKISIASDSSNYKINLPREILKTIKDNNAIVFNGVLVSNKVPIKVIK